MIVAISFAAAAVVASQMWLALRTPLSNPSLLRTNFRGNEIPAIAGVIVLIVATIGVALAVGMLWGAIQVIFNLGVNQVALSQAWIGTSDVLVVAPWLFGGVAVVALLTSLLTLRRYLRV